jgi:hypothetical protein
MKHWSQLISEVVDCDEYAMAASIFGRAFGRGAVFLLQRLKIDSYGQL